MGVMTMNSMDLARALWEASFKECQDSIQNHSLDSIIDNVIQRMEIE